MLSRRKTESEPVAEPVAVAVTTERAQPPRKGRPTPKRREQEAANRRPLVADRTSLSKEDKRRRRAERSTVRAGMMRGEERYLGPRDKGPYKRFLRDAVDRRWNIGEILLPVMLLILAASLIRIPGVQLIMFVAAYGLIVLGLVDSILLWRRTKARATQVFGEEPPRGSASYVVLRAFQMRMSRIPRPTLSRGDELRRR